MSYTRMVFESKGSTIKAEEAPLPELKEGQVLVKVEACGVCHSDVFTKEGLMGTQFPRAPGHEVAGVVAKVGPGAKRFKVGDRVGRGWHGSHCFECQSCLRGDFITCQKHTVSGIHDDGGYATHMVAPWESLAKIPDALSFEDAAPLLCAGITVFNSLRNAQVKPPALVAVQGVGGLGHFAIQFAAKMGYKVVALSRGDAKKELALKLGASEYIDTTAQDPVEELKKLGGADAILCTAFSSKSMSPLVDALAVSGQLLVLGADTEPVEVPPLSVIVNRGCVRGWPCGSAIDNEDTLKFAAENNVRPMIEVFPLSKAQDAFEHMMSNKARFRVVLKP